MIMDNQLINDYCEWLFDILFELRKRIQMPSLSSFQGRYYGRISEIIFNVWLNEKLETPCIHMEKINWFKKGKAFLNAKFLG